MKAIEGGVYCASCVGRLSTRSQRNLALRFPASHDEGKGTCWGCGETVNLTAASKVIRKEREDEQRT